VLLEVLSEFEKKLRLKPIARPGWPAALVGDFRHLRISVRLVSECVAREAEPNGNIVTANADVAGGIDKRQMMAMGQFERIGWRNAHHRGDLREGHRFHAARLSWLRTAFSAALRVAHVSAMTGFVAR
jgi:hypothetical protein